jgi:hypothetical protein
MKGSITLSETILEGTGILISFILIVLVVQLVFSQQSSRTSESVFNSLARDISTNIDRASAAAGSVQIQQDIPKGLKFDLTIDYKTLILKYGNGETVKNSFIGLTKSSQIVLKNPTTLCMVKSINDNRVTITDRKCQCNENDDLCDASCILSDVCDPKCISDPSGVCNIFCAKEYPDACDTNCYQNHITGICELNCIEPNVTDGVCSPDCNDLNKGICDLDCYNTFFNGTTGVCDPDCPGQLEEKIFEAEDGVKYKKSDGFCYTGCVDNVTKVEDVNGKIYKNIFLLPDGICDEDCKISDNVCDPDCKGSMSSEACKNKCTTEGNKTEKYPCCEGLIQCPGDKVCKKNQELACCGNSICEGRPGIKNGWGPGNKTKWETNFTCPIDCNETAVASGSNINNKPSLCQAGAFKKSVCYSNLNDAQGNFIGFEPLWKDNVFEVCNDEINKFLDRRSWNIKELIKTWKDPGSTPEAWAWDASRYTDACNRMNTASKTISANENFTLDIYKCCGLSGAACGDADYTPDCTGVGFCIDHSTAVVSALRTLGVPAKNVYSFFGLNDGGAHAWVLFYCDPNEPENRKPTECEGNWGKWLSIDATAHFVAPLKSISYTPCLMWNDQGIYAQTEGKINATHGYAYNSSIPRTSSFDPSLWIYDKLCKENIGVECVVP